MPAAPLDLDVYRLRDAHQLPTPAVVVYPSLVIGNIERALAFAEGNPLLLRPHVKTHKTAEVVRLQIERGITKHKCATLMEAELLAEAGAVDVLIAYQMVGPNIQRLVELVRRFENGTTFRVIVDHPATIDPLGEAFAGIDPPLSVLIDLNAGMGRTGIPLDDGVQELAQKIVSHSSLEFGGLHLYDGDVDSPDPAERAAKTQATADRLFELVDDLELHKFEVDRMVVSGTGTFAAWLALAQNEKRIEASPGTFVFSDWNYHERYPDLQMTPAAVLWTRVVSRPSAGRFTCDLGSKGVAADPAKELRVHFLELKSWTFVRQNEEHLVIDSPEADRLAPGDLLMALPYHICPTCALHRDLNVAEGGVITGSWRVAARDRLPLAT